MVRRSVRVGLDLGAQTLKAAWATRRFGGRVEWHYAQCRRSPGSSPDGLRHDLTRLLRPLRRRRVDASLVLCAPTSYVRSLTVRIHELKQLSHAVRDHLPTLLPFEVERAQYEFRVRHQQRLDGQWACQLSMAACEAAALGQDLQALWGAGWATWAVAPAALALAQTAKALHALGQDPAVLMEIAERRTTMALVEAGDVVYARDVALGTDHLTDALTARVSIGASAVSLAREEAASLIRETGIPDAAAGATVLGSSRLPTATYAAMLQPILEQLVSEVRRTMTFGAQAAKLSEPIRVLISGEGSHLPRIEPWLSQQLGMPVKRLNCESLLGSEGETAAIACGLALFQQPPEPNLQPRPARQRWLLVQSEARLWRALAAIAAAIWIGAGVWQLRRQAGASQVHTVQSRWAKAQPVAELQDALQAHTQLVQQLVVHDAVPLAWFGRLGSGFPDPVRLVSLSVKTTGEVLMDGEAQERDQTPEAYVFALGLWLEYARVCGQVQLESTTRTGENGSMVRFSLTCRMIR